MLSPLNYSTVYELFVFFRKFNGLQYAQKFRPQSGGQLCRSQCEGGQVVVGNKVLWWIGTKSEGVVLEDRLSGRSSSLMLHCEDFSSSRGLEKGIFAQGSQLHTSNAYLFGLPFMPTKHKPIPPSDPDSHPPSQARRVVV